MTETSRRPGPGGSAAVRICVVGDELVAGTGDPKSLGWVGRVSARTSRANGQVTSFALGVPGETTAGLLARWQEETARRFGDGAEPGRLVVGLGHQDVLRGVTLARSAAAPRDILDAAQSRGLPTFVVGPPPSGDDRVNATLADLSGTFADVCLRRRVPYVDAYTPLVTHEDWLTDLAAGDGVHPGQAGYGLIAWLVLHGGWHDWLGLPQH